MTSAGFELVYPRLAVGSADNSATRPHFFKIFLKIKTLLSSVAVYGTAFTWESSECSIRIPLRSNSNRWRSTRFENLFRDSLILMDWWNISVHLCTVWNLIYGLKMCYIGGSCAKMFQFGANFRETIWIWRCYDPTTRRGQNHKMILIGFVQDGP